jgi:MtrB/PioB family decaheme-associated outer membrane protein
MRTRALILSGALLLASSGLAQAQQMSPLNPLPTSPTIGRVDFGFRGDSLTGDEARYNRFRDLREGAYLDQFRFNKENGTWLFAASANNVGYRDQRYFAKFASIGKLKASFAWDQVPMFLSRDTRTLYTHTGNGVLAIDDSIQLTLQNAGAANSAPTTAALTNILAGLSTYDMKSRRDIGNFNLVYSLNRDVDFKLNLKNTSRNGTSLMSFGFGTSPGLNPSVELPIPVDDRTTDIRGGVEFANTRGLLAVGYTASLYENSIPTVRFDNPLRAVDISGGTSAGQAVMWPSNASLAFNVTGSYKLPSRSRANAAISFGRWTQDEPLVSPTVNAALVAPPLERRTAETKANILSMVYGFTSRPIKELSLNAKYRYYDYDNRSEHFEGTALIGDWALSTTHIETEPASFKRKTLDLDASYAPLTYVALGVGYGREDADRTWRVFETTTEDVFRVSADSTGNQYVSVRAKYEFSSRSGSASEGHIEHILGEVGEQPTMRHFDIADRDRSRVTGILTVTPIPQLGFNASVATGKDDYKETGFGLRDNKNRTWSVGFDFVPVDAVNFGVNYGYEKYTAFQYSRTANPLSATDTTFLDPRRDWWIDQDDSVKTWSANLDLMKAFPKTDIRLGYDLSDGIATYVYGVGADFPLTRPVQLAPLKNQLTLGTFDVRYFVRPNIALGAAYWFEDYDVDEFTLNSTTINQLNPTNASGIFASTIYSGYLYRNYTAHTFWLRMSYLW